MTPEDEAAWRAKLEGVGVSQVREDIKNKELWGDERVQVARRWLSEKERDAERRADSAIDAQMRIARSAKNAAWIAAIAAIAAAIAAIMANIH